MLQHISFFLSVSISQDVTSRDFISLTSRNRGVTSRLSFFPGLPAEEVASSLTRLGVVKTDGEVIHCGYY